MNVSYIGMTKWRNLGDESCFNCRKKLLEANHGEKIHLEYDGSGHEKRDPDFFVCGGGTLLHTLWDSDWHYRIKKYQDHKIPTTIFGTGVEYDSLPFGRISKRAGRKACRQMTIGAPPL